MFSSIIGQHKIKQILSNQIVSKKLAHAYIFTGESGIGKKLLAFEFAKVLNCSVNDWETCAIGACGRCKSCVNISNDNHPDIHFVDLEKQIDINEKASEKTKTILIDTIRYIQKKVFTKIFEGKWKFFIVESADKMEEAAANALLKILEEPPENTIIILIARYKSQILKTILSRSQILFFQPLKQEELVNWLMLNKGLNLSKSKSIASLSGGSIENAVKMIDETENDGAIIWRKSKEQKFFISDILEFSRKISKIGKNYSLECIDSMLAAVEKELILYPQKVSKIAELLLDAKKFINSNMNPQIVLDNLFFDLFDKHFGDKI
jgi:DNA polymerase-3 subunit delta'